MKKILPSFLIIISLFCFQTTKVSAQWATFDAANFGEWLANLPVQLGQLTEQSVSSASNFSLITKEMGLDPVAKVLANVAVKVATDGMMNYAAHGANGNPTFIVNPTTYFKNMNKGVAQTNINNLMSSDPSVATALARKIKGEDSSLSQKIAPTLSDTIQNDVCTDAGITALAQREKDRVDSAGVYVDGAQDLDSIKSRMRADYCTGDGSTKAQQTKLNDCFANDFNCGGWGAWLDLTANPNNTLTGRTIAANTITAQDQAQKQVEQKAITKDGGTLAVSDCKDEAASTDPSNTFYTDPTAGEPDPANNFYTDPTTYVNTPAADLPNDFYQDPTTYIEANNPNSTPCQKSEVKNSAEYISGQVNTALSAPLTTMVNVHEAGEVLTGLLSSAMNSFLSSGVSGSGSNPNYKPLAFADGENPDNVSDSTKSALTKPALIRLKADKKSADQLKATDNEYLSTLSGHASRLDILSGCYDSAVAYGKSLKSSSVVTAFNVDYLAPYVDEIASGRAYIESEKTSLGQKQDDLNTELSKVDSTLSAIPSIIDTLNTSSNSTEITDVITQYTNKKDAGDYIDSSDAETRRQEYYNQKPILEDGNISNSDGTTSPTEYKSKLKACQAMPSAMDTAKAAANQNF